MQVDSLREIYYKKPDKYEREYELRYFSPHTKHLNINIQQIFRKKAYPAFFQYTEEIARLLWDISKENFNLVSLYNKLPKLAMDQFWVQCIIEEIQATNEMEGVRSTRKEIRKAFVDIINGEKAKRFDTVINKYLNVGKSESWLLLSSKDIRTLYDYFVLDEVKREDPQDVPDGDCFRKGHVSIFSPTNKEIHKGLYPESEIINAMDYALELINYDSMPKLVAIAVYHYLFGYIHPFYNGNGRTSRFIASEYLSHEIDKLCSLRLSITMKKKRNVYYEMFEKTNDEYARGELTYFITQFLNIILSTITETEKLIEYKYEQLERNKINLFNKLDALGISDKTTIRIYEVLLESVLFGGNGLTIEEIKTYIGVSRNTVDARIASMPKEHYIRDTSSKAYKYRLNSLMLKESK